MSADHRSFEADAIVEDLLPVDLDWRRLVRSYPLSAMAVAVAGGFLVGRRHGLALVRDLTSFVTEEVTRNVQSLLDREPSQDPSDA
jgi:hypothetical protein